MILHRFSREKEFSHRIAAEDADKFRIRALDFVADGVRSDHEVTRFATWLAHEFESLRAVLIQRESDLALTFLPEVDFTIRTESIARLEDARARKDEDVLAARGAVNLLAQIPFSVIAYRPDSGRRTLIRVLCSHLAMDFITYRLMRAAATEWWGGARQAAGARPTYADWLSDCGNYVESQACRREIDEWAKWPLAPFQEARRVIDGLSGASLVKSSVLVPPPLVSIIRERCRGPLQCRLPEAVSAMLVSALSEAFGLEHVPLTWTAHGRGPVQGRSFHAVPGWLSSLHPVCIRADAKNPSAAIAGVREGLARCPNRGNTFAWAEQFVADAGWRNLTEALTTSFRINLRELTVRESTFRPDSAANSRLMADVERAAPYHEGKLHFHIVADIGAAIAISIRSSCDSGDHACKTLSSSIESAISCYLS